MAFAAPENLAEVELYQLTVENFAVVEFAVLIAVDILVDIVVENQLVADPLGIHREFLATEQIRHLMECRLGNQILLAFLGN